MAAEYRGEAESALLDAQTFNPRDARWPYYLAQLSKIKGDTSKSADLFARALDLEPEDVPTLLSLSALKFAIVAMWYMHLKFDHKLFSWLFVVPMGIAALVVLALIRLFAR